MLLKKINKKYDSTFSDVLYQVRNSLVHRSRLFVNNQDLLQDLMSVNDYFELFLYDVVSEYKKTVNADILVHHNMLNSYSI